MHSQQLDRRAACGSATAIVARFAFFVCVAFHRSITLQREDHDNGSETDAAVTLSDALSAVTPFASPRGEVQPELLGAPRSPDSPQRERDTNAEPLSWQDARPPSSMPGERNTLLPAPAREPLCWQDARPPHEAPGEIRRAVFLAVCATPPRRSRR